MALRLLKTGFLVVLMAGSGSNLQAQSEYLTHIRPTFWYNSIDGVKAGVRFFGYQDTPHTDLYRVQAGLWVNTAMQDQPVSYDVQLEHPLMALGAAEQEFTLGAQTRLMDGLQRHILSANKTFKTQLGNESYLNMGYTFTQYEMRSTAYLLYPGSWSTDVQNLHQVTLGFSNRTAQSYQAFTSRLMGGGSQILQLSGSVYHVLNKSFAIGIKAGHTRNESSASLPEHGVNLTYGNFFDWHDSPWFRSRGTLPIPAVESGVAVMTDGISSVRGYASHDADRFKSGDFSAITSITSVNIDIEIANPIDSYLRNIPVAGAFIRFQSRVFADAGRVVYEPSFTPSTDTHIGSAGIGFQLHMNIPDYNNRARGFTLRWELPVWVSDPIAEQNPIRPRHHLSFELSIPF